MTRAASIGTEYADVIAEAARRFGDHESMDAARILNWMQQFADADLHLAEKVLRQVKYFNANNIRNMTSQLVQIIADEAGATRGRSLFVPVDLSAGGGAQTIARALRNVRRPFAPRVATMVDLQSPPRNVETIVFLDDFAGTGDTLVEWWANVETLVRPLGANIIFGALAMTSEAVERAEELGMAVCIEEMGGESNALHDTGSGFDAGERAKLLDYCSRTGCSPRYIRGYGDAGLLLAFRHSCPNNSLPILWFDGGNWVPLFHRRAL